MFTLASKLERVTIKNFRSISKLELPLRQINVLVGRNNTGKTTIIEALAILLSSFNNYQDFIGNNILNLVSRYRDNLQYLIKYREEFAEISALTEDNNKIKLYIMKKLKEYKNIDKIVFEKINEAIDQVVSDIYEKEVIKLEKEIDKLRIRLNRLPDTVRFKSELEKEINYYKQILDNYLSKKDNILLKYRHDLQKNLILSIINLINNSVVSVYFIFSKSLESISSLYRNSVTNIFYEIEENEKLKNIQFLKVIAKPIYLRIYNNKNIIKQIDELPVEKVVELVDKLRERIPYFYDYRNKMIVFKFNEKKLVIPINSVGEGLLALLELLVPTVYGVRLNLIEEPELHMHPGFLEIYSEELLKFIKTNNSQYIMTTHSMDFLECLLKNARSMNLLNYINIIRLYRLSDGEIDAEILSGDEAYDELENIKGDLRGP